jgi:type VI secretion system protein ImpM
MSEALVIQGPGWFGKMPGAGDFASRRLPDGFVSGWDDWLQQGLVHAREELGEGWLELYLVAPIVRFWIAPPVFGDTAWAGIVMPSVDRVGRHYPLTVAQPAGALDKALAARDWYRAVDGIARRVLHVDATIDALEQELGAVETGSANPCPDDALLAQRLLLPFESGGRCSVWWCDDAAPGTRFHCFWGLPPPPAFLVALCPVPQGRLE